MANPLVIITGAGRGIGRATAIELSAIGYDVALVARTRSELDAVGQELTTRSLSIEADVSNADAPQRIVDEAVRAFGRIDAVVNNAGHAPIASFEDTTPALWRDVMATNLDAAFLLTRAAWPHLKQQGGAVVYLSSMAAKDPFDGFTAYATAKAAVNMLALMTHKQGRPQGIRGYAVAPGMTDTKMFRDLMGDTPIDATKTMDPSEVAKVIANCIAGDLKHASGETIYLAK